MVMMIVTVAAAYYPAGLRLGGSEPPTANTKMILLGSHSDDRWILFTERQRAKT
jgi:hypothetical protein